MDYIVSLRFKQLPVTHMGSNQWHSQLWLKRTQKYSASEALSMNVIIKRLVQNRTFSPIYREQRVLQKCDEADTRDVYIRPFSAQFVRDSIQPQCFEWPLRSTMRCRNGGGM